MNSLYLPILVVHVIFAVLGAGAVASVAVVAGSARRAGRIRADALASVGALLRWSAIDLDDRGLGRLEIMEQVSMAFLVVLQRLTPVERAVLLLRDVFDFEYAEIAALVDRNEAACRKVLERARRHVASEKRSFSASPEVHRRLLDAFTRAAAEGDIAALVAMLAEDAVMITDGGAEGRRVGRIRNLPAPLTGAHRIAAFVSATAGATDLLTEVHELNGQPALVFYEGEAPFAGLVLGVVDERIHRVFFHADLSRLRWLGPRRDAS